MQKSMLIDTSLCIGCRACQAACKQWNQLPAEKTTFTGSYENPARFSPITWTKIVFREHEGQNRLSVVTRSDVDDSFDGFLPSWGHEECDLEGDPVRIDTAFGREQGQDHQVMKPAGHGLALSLKPSRWIEISVKQVRSNDRLDLEADPFRFLADIDQYPGRSRQEGTTQARHASAPGRLQEPEDP